VPQISTLSIVPYLLSFRISFSLGIRIYIYYLSARPVIFAVSTMSKSPPVVVSAGAGAPVSVQPPTAAQTAVDREKVYQWIIELAAPDTRETALLELSKKRQANKLELHDVMETGI
jgi:hypothetical protein